MFAVRGIAVSFSIFVMLYGALVVGSLRRVEQRCGLPASAIRRDAAPICFSPCAYFRSWLRLG